MGKASSRQKIKMNDKISATSSASAVKHVKVYYQPGRYGGWPANNGIWSWGNEILVGLVGGHHKEKTGHTIDPEKPRLHLFGRSLDGGETWSIEDAYESGLKGAAENNTGIPGASFKPPVDCPGGINFTHPDFAMTLRRMNNGTGPSHFYYSYDRGKAWEGPFSLPDLGTQGIAARTDYIVNSEHDCMIFLTAAKSNRREGRVFCARTIDGGKTWEMVSWIGPEPEGYSIMPASVRLSSSDILVVIRRREREPEGSRGWLASYLSEDNGQNWRQLDDPVSELGGGSNPPALIKLKDGRLCLNYGVRVDPYRICAKLSADQGRTWSEEIVLRSDGANGDIGYPRNVQRPDGKVVTIYYFNDPKTGVERYIGASIWNPGNLA